MESPYPTIMPLHVPTDSNPVVGNQSEKGDQENGLNRSDVPLQVFDRAAYRSVSRQKGINARGAQNYRKGENSGDPGKSIGARIG